MLSSTSNHEEQTALEIRADTSKDRRNIKEMPDLEKANHSRKFAPVDSKRDSNMTVEYQELIKAIQRGDVFKINEFADKKKDLFMETSPRGNTVLHIAARYGNWLVIDQILRRDDENYSFIYRKNHKGETPLHIAAKYGNLIVVIILFYHGDESRMREKGLLKMKDKEGNTPLHNAVGYGNELIAEILIDADVTSILDVNKSEQSPLPIAIDGRLSYIACFIIKTDPFSLDHKGPEQLTPLHSAVIRQDYDIVVDILKSKPDLIDTVDIKKWNPLHFAAASGHVKIARYLCEVKASLVYEPDIKGQTPLHLATKNDRQGVLKMLLKDYPDSIEMIDNRNRNILHVAAQNGNLKIVSFILRLPEMEDLVNSGDEEGNTPLHLAAMEFKSDVVYIFSKYTNVNIRATNKKMQTALVIVETSTLRGNDIQKHLTIKTLRAAYADRGLYEEDIRLEHRQTLKVAHSDRALDTEDRQLEHRSLAASEYIDGESGKGKEMAQTLSVINPLIATFTFTAAFTIPGGFRSDGPNEGSAVLVTRTSFQAFVVTDAISMTSSMTAAVIVLWSYMCNKSESFMNSLPWAIGLTWIGLVSMTLAFVTGLYAVLSEIMALAVTVSTIGWVLPFILYVYAPLISLVSGQSAHINPFAFSFKMVKLFLKKPIVWCFRCLSKRSCLRTRNKAYFFAALIHKILFGLIYYWIKALVIVLPRWIKELAIALSQWMKALVTALSTWCSPRHKSI